MGSPQNQVDLDRLFLDERPRVLATLIRILGDIDLAEDAVQSAFVAASHQWHVDGVPSNPRAWLISTGRFKAIDALRKDARTSALSDEIPAVGEPIEFEAVDDDCLRLIFICCHPSIPQPAQIALTLREVCGLTTEEIARAFLTSPTTIGQRIVRAKAKIRDEHLPYELPSLEELGHRLEAVLRVAYLVFNEGYYASAGYSLTRASISDEAIRLTRLLVTLLPEPEVFGLLALMILHESRRSARASVEGDIILLPDQDRGLWKGELISEGVALVQKGLLTDKPGPYLLQAAISAVHATAQSAADTEWNRIVSLYDQLATLTPSPVVDLNRAVAVGMRDGFETGLQEVGKLLAQGSLDDYPLAYSVRADFARRLGRVDEARSDYNKALEMTTLEPERRFLQRRLKELID